MSIKVILDNCTGCTLCVKACPFAAITMLDRPADAPGKSKKIAIIDLDTCTLCKACLESCKFGAIEIELEKESSTDISHFKGVWRTT